MKQHTTLQVPVETRKTSNGYLVTSPVYPGKSAFDRDLTTAIRILLYAVLIHPSAPAGKVHVV